MTTGALIWMVILTVSAACFFGVAAVVSVLGVRDVKDLLQRHSGVSTRRNHDHG